MFRKRFNATRRSLASTLPLLAVLQRQPRPPAEVLGAQLPHHSAGAHTMKLPNEACVAASHPVPGISDGSLAVYLRYPCLDSKISSGSSS
jgi:hypothetical protein